MSRIYICSDREDRKHLFVTDGKNHFMSEQSWLTLGGSIRTARVFERGERIIKDNYDGKTYSKEGPYVVLFAGALTPEQLQRVRIKAEHMVEPFAKLVTDDPTLLGDLSRSGAAIKEHQQQFAIQELESLLK